jgi:hypothetical protein
MRILSAVSGQIHASAAFSLGETAPVTQLTGV